MTDGKGNITLDDYVESEEAITTYTHIITTSDNKAVFCLFIGFMAGFFFGGFYGWAAL